MKLIGIILADNNKIEPHMLFETQDDAAANFVRHNNPRTHDDNKERGTYIYKMKAAAADKFFYLNETAGGHDHVIKRALFDYVVGYIFDQKRWPVKAHRFTPIAFVHTHPSCACHAGELFSKQDKMMTLAPGISTVYLGSPNGKLYAYDGISKIVRIVSSDMPATLYKFPDSKGGGQVRKL